MKYYGNELIADGMNVYNISIIWVDTTHTTVIELAT